MRRVIKSSLSSGASWVNSLRSDSKSGFEMAWLGYLTQFEPLTQGPPIQLTS